MEPNDHDADEQLGELLEAYDSALAAGQDPGEVTPQEAPAPLRTELASLQACLRRLERAWPRRAQTSSPDETLISMPARLGRYQLVRLLGAGGFGLVYLAWDPQLRREVAIKVPRPEALLTPSGRARILREAQTAAGLDHPHLVPVYEAGEVGPAVYLVSAYCPGQTLEQWLKDHPTPVPIRSAVELLARLADAVQYMHTRGILHRDLKPANILLAGDRRQKTEDRRQTAEGGNDRSASVSAPSSVLCPLSSPKITDFGLAKDLQRRTQLTRTGTVLGTPAYMAPEQVEGQSAEVGPATDVYALGVILYEVLTRQTPFRGANGVDIVRRILSDEPPEPRRLRPEVPPDLQTICLQCLRKEPARRYLRAADLTDDLCRFLRGEPIRARPVSMPRRVLLWIRRRPAAAGLIAVCATALLGLLAGGAWHLVEMNQKNAELRQMNRDLEGTNAELRATAARERQQRELAEDQARRLARSQYVKFFQQAVEAQERGQTARAMSQVDSIPSTFPDEDLRGFEWYYLRGWCHPELLARRPDSTSIPPAETLAGHTPAPVRSLAFAPDSRTLAATGDNHEVHLWDTASGGRRARLRGHGAPVTGVAFSPDGRTIASASADRTVKLWDADTGKLRTTLDAGDHVLHCLAFAPDGQLLAAGAGAGADGRAVVCLWHVATGRPLPPLTGHQGSVLAVVFAPDGKTLAAATAAGKIRTWDATSWHWTSEYHEAAAVHCLAYTPDSVTLASGNGIGIIHLRRRTKGRLYQVDRLHAGQVNAVAFSPDGRTLASAGEDRTVRLWQTATGAELMVLTGHATRVHALAFAPDGTLLASADEDGVMKLWHAAPKETPTGRGGEAPTTPRDR